MLDSPSQQGREDLGVVEFSVAVHPHRNQVVVAPSGDIDLTTAGAVGGELTELRRTGFDDIVVDLRAVTFIDSSGLHLLLTEARKAKQDGYRFRLVGASPAARRLFEITGTSEIFEVVEQPA